MAEKDKGKMRILNLIRDKKDTLFGAFSPKLTKIDKQDAWEEILEEGKRLGLIPSAKDINYIRDVFWQNLRKRTLKKMDESQVTGGAGGEKCIMDDMDHLVLDIIGELHRYFTFFCVSN